MFIQIDDKLIVNTNEIATVFEERNGFATIELVDHAGNKCISKHIYTELTMNEMMTLLHQ